MYKSIILIVFYTTISFSYKLQAQTNLQDSSLSHRIFQFSKIYKTCRYFYPTNKYSSTQWDSLLLEGVSMVLNCSEKNYETNLTLYFKHYFPLINFSPKESKHKKTNIKNQVYWQYLGFSETDHPIYQKRLINAEEKTPISGFQFWLDEKYDLKDVIVELKCKARKNTSKKLNLVLRIEAFNYALRKDSIVEKSFPLNNKNEVFTIENLFQQGKSYLTFLISKEGKEELLIDEIEYIVKTKEKIIIEKGILNLKTNSVAQIPNSSIRNPYGIDYTIKNESLSINNIKGKNEKCLYDEHPKPNAYHRLTFPNFAINIPVSITKRKFLHDKPQVIKTNNYSFQTFHLAAFIKFYSVFSTFYPYNSTLNLNQDSIFLNYLPRMLNLESPYNGYEMIQQYVSELKDGHAYVHNDMAYKNLCIKADFEYYPNGIFVVGADPEGNLKMGDQLLSINNEDIMSVLDRKMLKRSGSGQWKQKRETFIIGCGDTTLIDTYTIKRLSDTLEFQIKKDSYAGSYLEPSLKSIELLDSNVYYIDASRINYNAFFDTINTLKASNGIIVDLREYPILSPQFLTHFHEQTLYSSNWLIPKIYGNEPTMVFDTKSPWELKPNLPRLTIPVVFLIGTGTISYAESLLDIIKKYKLGTVIGTKSAGANGNQTQFTFCSEYKVYFTGMNVKQSDGVDFFSTGMEPDIYYDESFNMMRNDLINFAKEYLIKK